MSLPEPISSKLEVYPIRLTRKHELKSSLINFVTQNNLGSGFIMTCCGSVTKATLRLAEKSDGSPQDIVTFDEHFEICSLVGTIASGSAHLHICLGRADGTTVAGHVIGDLEIFTTAEVVIGVCPDVKMSREYDPDTGYDELKIENL